MKLQKLFRAIGAKDVKLDKEARTIEFPFSSEYPVDRWFGKEILSHERGAADLTRLNDGGVALWNHDTNTVIGVVERAELRADKRLWATVRFSSNTKAQEVMKDIEDGILRNVSFGYQIEEMMLTKSDKKEGDEYTATKWMPFEVSIVSVPADPTVGIGRSEDNEEEFEVRILKPLKGEKRVTPEEIAAKAAKEEADRKAAGERDIKVREDAVKAERDRVSAINALGERLKKPELARQLIEGGKSIEEARQAYLESVGIQQKPISEGDAEIGMSTKEKRAYSFMTVLRALANPGDRRMQEAASFEREVSEAAAKHAGKTPQGFLVPYDVLRSKHSRDLTVGTSTAGGHTVATDLMAESFIEMLRKRMILDKVGVKMMNGLRDSVAIPRQTGGATAYWVAENSAVTESAQAFDQVTMSPKTLGAFTDYSRKLLNQSSIDVESFVKGDLAKVLGLEIDRVGLYGSGASNQPLGLYSQGTGTPGGAGSINLVDFAANAPTYAEIVQMESAIAADNADEGSMAFLTNALGRGVLKGVDKASGAAQFVWENGNTVAGYRALVSNQVSQVASSKEHYWLGNFADLILGFWSGLDLMVDPYAGATAGTVRIIALQDMDVAVRHPESFCIGTNLT